MIYKIKNYIIYPMFQFKLNWTDFKKNYFYYFKFDLTFDYHKLMFLKPKFLKYEFVHQHLMDYCLFY